MDDTPVDDLSLRFDEFAPLTADEWQTAAVASNSGKPFDKLITPTYEGIPLQPIYGREATAGLPFADTAPGQPPYVRGATAQPVTWAVAQEAAGGDPVALNHALLADLQRGQTAVSLVLDRLTRTGQDPDARPDAAGQDGLSLATPADVAAALAGVYLEAVPLFINSGPSALPLLALLSASPAGETLSQMSGNLGADPLGALAEVGSLPLALERAYDEMAQVTAWLDTHAPALRAIAVNVAPYHDAGANAVQELAYALATGVAYLRALDRRGIQPATAAAHIRFEFAIGGQFFMEVAKLRAARLLWAQVVDAFGVAPTAAPVIHARTARRNKATLDPYVNMLRVTTEALAAVVGGANSLHVAPFDEPLRPADDFSRRIARNVQTILQREVHLTKLIDPAGGSYAVEALTDQLAHAAWALFQAVEREGGMATALANGSVQAAVAAVAEKRAAALAKRRDVMVGVNQYANPAEKPLPPNAGDDALGRERAAAVAEYRAAGDVTARTLARQHLAKAVAARPTEVVDAAIAAVAAGATLGDLVRDLRPGEASGPTVTPLPHGRAAEPFEALRRKALSLTLSHGEREPDADTLSPGGRVGEGVLDSLSPRGRVGEGVPPRLFLANLGPPRQHKARADFTQAFFEVGGFQVITNNGFPTPDEAAAAALASGAPAVAICSTDETYPDLVPPLVAAIKAAAPNTVVVLAGRPAEQVEALRAVGVDEFIYLGADALAVNGWLLKATGEA